MNKTGQIIIIDDDDDDQLLIQNTIFELGYSNPIISFADGYLAMDYLDKDDVRPFLIICDINMPKINGLKLRREILENLALRNKCIPFIFFSTGASAESVMEAYNQSAQGFFIKPTDIAELREVISSMLIYWSKCYSPGKFPELNL